MPLKTILITLGILATFLFPHGANAAEKEVDFIRENVSKVLAILSDVGLNDVQKATRFQEEIQKTADVDVIAKFVLGPYASSASPEEMKSFAEAFREYALGVYQSELGRFGSEAFEVLGAQERRPGDTIVMTRISGGAMKNKFRDIKWRVMMIKNSPQVVDIEISGVWLSQHQRAEITGIIAKNNGRISAATKMLCARATDCRYTG
jgi:phospholipid transport system substrate-binding protein